MNNIRVLFDSENNETNLRQNLELFVNTLTEEINNDGDRIFNSAVHNGDRIFNSAVHNGDRIFNSAVYNGINILIALLC